MPESYPPHSLAEKFPPAAPEAYVVLRESIRARGLDKPIVLFEGRVLDGLNRQRACLEVGAELRTTEFAGDDPVAFVIDQNLARRDLTPTQRAVLAAELQREMESGNKRREARHRAQRSADRGALPVGSNAAIAAARVGASEPMVNRVRRVERERPDLYRQLGKPKSNGREYTVNSALREMGSPTKGKKRASRTSRSPAVKASERAAEDRAALALVSKAANAARTMQDERDAVASAIGRIAHQQDVDRLALHVGWAIRGLQEVEARLRNRLDAEQRAQVDAQLSASERRGGLRVIGGRGA